MRFGIPELPSIQSTKARVTDSSPVSDELSRVRLPVYRPSSTTTAANDPADYANRVTNRFFSYVVSFVILYREDRLSGALAYARLLRAGQLLLSEAARDSLELVPIAQRHAATGAVNAPTDPAILFVADVFEINEDFRAFAKADRAAQADQSVTRQRR